MSAPNPEFHVHINLAALANGLFLELQSTAQNVAAALSTSDGLTLDSFKLPDTGIVLHPLQAPPRDLDSARVDFVRWIVSNGLRDAIEAVGRLLEGYRHVLALWALGEGRDSNGTINAQDWHRSIHDQARSFHRLGLPHKLNDLRTRFGFSIDADSERQILSINRLRNCLVHRRGRVTDLDVDDSGSLIVHWLRFVLIVSNTHGEREITLPAIVEEGGTVKFRSLQETRTFARGDSVDLGLSDFNNLCWTLFVFATAAGKQIEDYGRAKGIAFALTPEEQKREDALNKEH